MAVKKKELLPIVTAWVDLESLMLSEISQSEKKNTIWSDSYVESNEHNKLTSKIKPEAWIHGTDRQIDRGRVWGNWKRFAKVHIWITHRHRWPRGEGQGVGIWEYGGREEKRTSVIVSTVKNGIEFLHQNYTKTPLFTHILYREDYFMLN